MPISTLGLILINIGLALLQRLIAPRLPRRKPAPFESPTVEDGQPITKGFGIFQVSGMVTMVRDVHTTEGVNQSSSEDLTLYYAKMQMAAGFGPLDMLYDIVSDERSIALAVPSRAQSLGGAEPLVTDPPLRGGIAFSGDDPIVLTIAVRQLYGGQTQEGGLQGQLRIYPGTDDQAIDPLVAVDLGADASAFPHTIHAVFGTAVGEPSTSGQGDDFYWIANSGTPKPINFIFGSYPNRLLGVDDCRIGLNANPAEMLYELFVNQVWGKGEDPSTLDLVQWQAKALQLKAEAMGLSELFVNRTLEDIKDDILSHILGEIVTDPITGLVQLKLARDDYNIADLPVVTSENSDSFRQGEAQFSQTLNEVKVKYKRFEGGATGPQTVVLIMPNVFGEPPFPISETNISRYRYDSGYTNITDITATRDRAGDVVTLERSIGGIVGVDYYVNETTGEFQFFHNVINSTQIQAGDVVTLTFTAAPTFSGFVDATATAQNPANRLITGILRSEAYDYPMFTTESAAQRKADLLIKTVSRKLAVFSWKAGREFAHLTPLDVVNINDPEKYRLTNFPVRITKITIGPLEDPGLVFEGVEDVWGEKQSLALINVVAPPPVTPTDTAPPMASFYCAGEDVLQFQASDPTFLIEIERADDTDGTNAEEVEDSPFAGTTTTWTDPTPGKTHRARLIRDDVLPGPWTDWLSVCTDGLVDCVPTQFIDSAMSSGLVGTLAVDIEDPQGRFQFIEFQVRTADGILGPWTTDSVAPYEATVALVEGATSYITRRGWAHNCSGVLTPYETTHPFTVAGTDPGPDPGSDPKTVPVELLISTGVNVLEIPSELTDIMLDRDGEVQFPVEAFSRMRLTSSVRRPGTIGSYLQGRFEVVSGIGIYANVGVDDLGPVLPIDETALALLDTLAVTPEGRVAAGPWYLIRPEAKGDVRLKVQIAGGDNATGDFFASRLSIQLDPRVLPVTVEPPEVHDPPPDDPGSCDVPAILDDFSYADLAAFDAAWTVV